MANVSTVSTKPQVGNRFGTDKIVQANRELTDQRALNATINRVNRVRESYRAVHKEGARAGNSIREKGRVMASTGAERAQELRTMVEEGVSDVTNGTAKSIGNKTALIQARNQGPSVEVGKGTNFDAES